MDGRLKLYPVVSMLGAQCTESRLKGVLRHGKFSRRGELAVKQGFPARLAPLTTRKVFGSPLLERIGKALDNDLGCVVYSHGYVWPVERPLTSTLDPAYQKEVIAYEAQRATRPERPAARPRSGAAGRDSPEGTATPGSRTPFLRQLKHVEAGASRATVTEVLRAYPQFRVRSTARGIWMTGTIQPVQDLDARAILTMVVPISDQGTVYGWAWWEDGIWIGPRHTNWSDGSICAFEPKDNSWIWEMGLVALVDMYVVWITRHLHLAAYGRWPGRQVLHTAYERLTEHGSNEFCGCGSDLHYEECCRASDIERGLIAVLMERPEKLRGAARRPILPLKE